MRLVADEGGNFSLSAALGGTVTGPPEKPPEPLPNDKPTMKFIAFAIVSAASLALSGCEVQGSRAGDSHLNDGNRMNDGKMMSASDRVAMDQAGEDRVSSTVGVKR